MLSINEYTILYVLYNKIEEIKQHHPKEDINNIWECIKTTRRYIRDKHNIELEQFRISLDILNEGGYIETNISMANKPIFRITDKGKELLKIVGEMVSK